MLGAPEFVIDQVISGYLIHGKCHSSLYEGDHRNDNFTFSSICKNLVWGTILQGYSLRDMVPNPKAPHSGGRIYSVLEPTHLIKLKGNG